MASSGGLFWASFFLWIAASSAIVISSDASLRKVGDPDIHIDNIGHPIYIMLTHGCSGSTGGFYILRRLLHEAMGRKRFDLVKDMGNEELFDRLNRAKSEDEIKNALEGEMVDLQREIFKASTYLEKVKLVHARAAQEGYGFLSKLQLDVAKAQTEAMTYLFGKLHARPVVWRRRNLIDSLACRIHDFCATDFFKKLGHNVDADGKVVPCEFRGRTEKARTSAPKIWANVSGLIEHLKELDSENVKDPEYLRDVHGLKDVKTFDAEDLFKFEYDIDKLQYSAKLWQDVLAALGHRTRIEKITNILKSYQSNTKFPAQPMHSEVFVNFAEVKDALKGTEFEAMLSPAF